jgi:carboxyl-terminal processing protease
MSQREKRTSFWPWQPLIIFSVFAFGIVIGGTLNIHSPASDSDENAAPGNLIRTKSDHYKIVDALRFIETQYIEKVDTENLMDIALHAILDSLDPHSYYIDKAHFKDISERTRGDFEGIGVEYIRIKDTVVIIRVMKDGPAQKAGLNSGDMILQANGVELATIENTDSIKNLIKGPSGSIVKLAVHHPATDQTQTYRVKRNLIPYHSVEFSSKLNSNTGFIKLSHFNGNAYKEFMGALEGLTTNNRLQNLIIDLRDNPGGYLSEVVKILSQLFEQGNKLLVYTKNRDGVQKKYKSTGKTFYSIDNIALLVNANSASASEILAGAIQDWERGTVFGQRTYGKGLVQEQFNLGDQSAIRLTTAKYLTPSGRMIQRPYKNVDYSNNNEKRLDNGEFYSADSISGLDSTTYKTQYGSDLISGKGIIPDIFLPLDSFYFSDCYYEMSPHIHPFIYNYIHKSKSPKSDLASIPSIITAWNKYLKKEVDLEAHCFQSNDPNDHLIAILVYHYYMYQGDKQAAYTELIHRDKSVQQILLHFEQITDRPKTAEKN